MKDVRTYADGFGTWHAEVDQAGIGNAAEAHAAAFAAIEEQIKARHQDDILHGIRPLRPKSQNGILTHYFVEVGPEELAAA